MMMSEQPKLVIRDAVLKDIEQCLQLDSSFHTEHVWQMTIREESEETHITLRQQRLPRPLDADHNVDVQRLKNTIDPKQCFIVLKESTSNNLLGYLSMRVDLAYRIAYLHDLVIDTPYRRQRLGSRLINVAQLWANEQELNRIIFEVATINYPAIEFAKSQGFMYSGFNDQYLPNQEIALFYNLDL